MYRIFLEMITLSRVNPFKCHMCRRQYKWKKEALKTKEIPSVDTLEEILEERIEVLIREDNENLFLPLVGMNSKAFEVIVRINNNSFVFNPRQNIIQFIVVLETQIDTETLKFLIPLCAGRYYWRSSKSILQSL